MIEKTPKQAEFHSKLDLWFGIKDGEPEALNWIENIRIQAGYIVLELIDDDGYELEYAISLFDLMKSHNELFFSAYVHPSDIADEKAEILAALRSAVDSVEQFKETPDV